MRRVTVALLAAGALACRAPMRVIPDPHEVRPYEEQLRVPHAALLDLEGLETRYLGTPLEASYRDARGTLHSFVGEYGPALLQFDRLRAPRPGAPGDFAGFGPEDAVAVVLREAERRQAVFVNEAHHVPRHRDFTRRLLAGLYARGYRYFAAEAFSHVDQELARRGYPVRASGHYVNEPVFGELVREAIRLGYFLVPYESTETVCEDPPGSPNHCQNRRERAQAENLYQGVFAKDPKAKLLVHAGYGHIDKLGSGGWLPMARVFAESTGIDPFCVDQVTLMERSDPRLEPDAYRGALELFAPAVPILLSDARGRHWKAPGGGSYDAYVIHPRAAVRHSRPEWLLSGRRAEPVPLTLCGDKLPCLFQAFRWDEPPESAVPADQILARSVEDPPALAVPPGDYVLVAFGPDGRERGRRRLAVP